MPYKLYIFECNIFLVKESVARVILSGKMCVKKRLFGSIMQTTY